MSKAIEKKAKGYSTREERIEREANYFARCILIPEHLLFREIDKITELRDEGEKRITGLYEKEIDILSTLFAVDIKVMVMRLTELDIIG